MQHRTYTDLLGADFPSEGKIMKTPQGYLLGWNTTTPSDSTDIGFAPGAMFIHTAGSADDQTFINEGTKASSTWTVIGSVG